MLDLTKFCSRDDDPRPHLKLPWKHKGFEYASNGHIMVRVPAPDAVDTICEHKIAESAVGMFARARLDGFGPLPDFAMADPCRVCDGAGRYKQVECEACKGEGEFMHFEEMYDCQTCEGHGMLPDHNDEYKDSKLMDCVFCRGMGYKSKHIAVNDAGFQAYYLSWIQTLPGLQVTTNGAEQAMHFKFEGGAGLLMPMRE